MDFQNEPIVNRHPKNQRLRVKSHPKYSWLLFLSFGFLIICNVSATDVVWAPLATWQNEQNMDIVNAYRLVPATPNVTVPPNPDFPDGFCNDNSNPPLPLSIVDCRAKQKSKVANILITAAAKGINVIDVPFYSSDSAPLQNACNAAYSCHIILDASARVGSIWLEAVNEYNASNSRKLGVRIRVPATGKLNMLAWRSDLTAYPLGTLDLLNLPGSIQECTGTQNFGSGLLDLADSKTRDYIGKFTQMVLNDARSKLAPGTLKEATLTLENAWETDLWGDESKLDACNYEPNFSSFSNGRYPGANASFMSRYRYFRDREGFLKATYKTFASAAKAIDPTIKTAVFMQSWSFDSRIRGTFDLYGLLKGTGIDVLHHDDFVNNGATYLTRLQHQEDVAEAATIARTLGIQFDEELSWAHYTPSPLSTTDCWTGYSSDWGAAHWPGPVMLPSFCNHNVDNASSYLAQASVALQSGGIGFSYGNWMMPSIANPPTRTYSTGTPPGTYPSAIVSTDPSWKALIGANPNTGAIGANNQFLPNSGEAVNDQFLNGTGGIVSTALANPYATATKAIYLSTLGRMEYEEGLAGSTPPQLEGVRRLWSLFSQSGFDQDLIASKKVDIITDKMILDGTVNLDAYSAIYLPYEMSKWVDIRVLNAFVKRASNANVQWRDGSGTLKGFADWRAGVKSQNVLPMSYLSLLLN